MNLNNKTVEIKIVRNKIFEMPSKSRKRYVCYKGSAGSGKSTDIAMEFIKRLSDDRFKGSNLLCIRKVGESNRDSTFAELKKAIHARFGEYAEHVWDIPTGRSCSLYLKNKITGAEVLFRGCNNSDDIEKIKSINFTNGKLTWIWVEEANEITNADLDVLDDRLRGILPDGLFYQIVLSFNPVMSWIKNRFYDMPDANAFLSHSTWQDNQFIDDAYRIRMDERKKRDPEGYRIYGLGEWGCMGGLILSNWEVKEFDTDRFNNHTYGQDFGFNHANAILDVSFYDDDIYINRELVVYEKDTNEIIEQANSENWRKDIEMFCDSAEPDRIRMWQKAGYYRACGVKKEQGSVKAQIDYLKGVISKDLVKKRKIYIHPSCTNTIREIQQWRWKMDKSGAYIDEPVDIMDDTMAALRYSIERQRRPLPTISF